VCKLGFFWYEWARLKREWNERFKGPHLSKSVHIGEHFQILTVMNKKKIPQALVVRLTLEESSTHMAGLKSQLSSTYMYEHPQDNLQIWIN
jgi:hypothetical protein